MKIGVLTSSRADFGIYLPLLKKIRLDDRFEVIIIAFGMHLQASQGDTFEEIKKEGFESIYEVGSMPKEDDISDITLGYGELIKDFSKFWSQLHFDLILALGDRWEMSAAVQSMIPFEIKIAHIHGGETTLGAIDNIYRHQISLASTLHFTAAEEFSKRVIQLIGHSDNVHTVGSISLEGLDNISLPNWEIVKEEFQIPFEQFILVTFHPESVEASRNKNLSKTAFNALQEISKEHNLLITQANSDAMGSLFNTQFNKLAQLNPSRVKLVKSLGKLNYFKAIEQCECMLGNSSSGIIEAASFKKWVINVGDRQKGRLRNENIKDVIFSRKEILDALDQVLGKKEYDGGNKYSRPNSTNNIISLIYENA